MSEPEFAAAAPESDDIASIGARPARAGSVLVVSSAPVTATVVSRIVEMTGLKCAVQAPAAAEKAVLVPGLAAVIVDEDAELAARLSRSLAGGTGRRVLVMLLATGGALLEAARRSPHVDAVVAKPVTADSLQPLLFDLRHTADDPGSRSTPLSLHRSQRL
jgi:hypothetical protein